MNTERKDVYAAIDGERSYQESRWNSWTTTTNGKHSNIEFLVYIQDYVQEALHFASRNGDPAGNIFCQENLRKIAALAVAAMEQNGVAIRYTPDLRGHRLP